MAIATPTTTTALTNWIDSEWIQNQLKLAVATPFVGEQIVGMVDLSGQSTRTYAHPILSRMSAASAYAEGGEFTSTPMATTEQTISVGYVLESTFLTPHARGATVLNSAAAAVQNVVDSVRQKSENDVLGLSSSLSNTTGSNATNNTLSNWSAVLTTFRAQAKSPNMVAAVMHPDAVRDLHADATGTNNAALFGSAMGPEVERLFGSAAQGARGVLDGVMIYESDAIPVADTTGWGNIMTEIGSNAALVMVVKTPITLKIDEPADALGDWIAAYTDYGVGIVDQNRALQFITRT